MDRLHTLECLDKYLAELGIILSLFLIIFMVWKNFRILFLLTGFLTLFSCLIWLFVRENVSINFNSSNIHLKESIFNIIFFTLFTISIFLVYFRSNLYERPLLYFILISLMVGILSINILFSTSNMIYSIFIKIILLNINIVWSQLLLFPGLLGKDPWFHRMFTLELLETHFLPIGNSYSYLPIFHLYIGLTSLMADLDYKFAMMLSADLAQILCNTMFIFLLGNYLFNNHKIGLLASLLMIISNYYINACIALIPSFFAEIFVIIIIYILLKSFERKTVSNYVMILLLIFALIATHPLTSTYASIIFLIFWAIFIIYNASYFKPAIGAPVTLTLVVLFNLIMFSWWIYASKIIVSLGQLISWGFSVDKHINSTELAINYAANTPLFEQIFNNLGMFLFFSMSFVGFFYIIYKNENPSRYLGFISVTPLLLGYTSIMSGHTIVEHRWWYFAQVLLSLPLAIALIILTIRISVNEKLRIIILSSFIFVLSFLMIMSPVGNYDSYTFSPNTKMRYALTDGELMSVHFMSDKSYDPINVDAYLTILSFIFENRTINTVSSEIYSGDFNKVKSYSSLVLIRDYILHYPFILYKDIYELNYDIKLELSVQGFSNIYDSKSIDIFKYLF